jgi:hypothetical protein
LNKAAIKFNIKINNVFSFNFLQDHIVGKQNDMRTKIGQSNREEEQFVQEMLIKRRLFFSPFFSPTFFFTFNRRQAEHTVILSDPTLKKWALSSFAFQSF